MENKEKIKSLRIFCQKNHIDGILISSYANIAYLTNYFGFTPEERDAYCLITPENAYLFTNSLYLHEVKEKVPSLTVIGFSQQTPLSVSLSLICEKEKLQSLGFEEQDIRYAEHAYLSAKLPCVLTPISLRNIRVLKTSKEIHLIQEACNIGDKAFTFLLSRIREGVTETELAFELEIFVKEQYADFAFSPIIAFGKNAAIPHHKADDTKLKSKQAVLMDFGVKYKGYCSDMTRTVYFGNPSKKEKDMYQAVLDAQNEALAALKNGVALSFIDKVARDFILTRNYPSIPYSLGHGIGMEVHEAPSLYPHSNERLINGMVFSIEPGIHIPGIGGVRIEDIVSFEDNKVHNLTTSQREIIVL